MNHEDYCSYELSKKLKEKGFDWPSPRLYKELTKTLTWCHILERRYEYLSAPTISQAQKWLREVKGIAINVIAHDSGFYQWEEIYLPNAPEYDGYIKPDITQYSTYEQALSAGITKALELI